MAGWSGGGADGAHAPNCCGLFTETARGVNPTTTTNGRETVELVESESMILAYVFFTRIAEHAHSLHLKLIIRGTAGFLLVGPHNTCTTHINTATAAFPRPHTSGAGATG